MRKVHQHSDLANTDDPYVDVGEIRHAKMRPVFHCGPGSGGLVSWQPIDRHAPFLDPSERWGFAIDPSEIVIPDGWPVDSLGRYLTWIEWQALRNTYVAPNEEAA